MNVREWYDNKPKEMRRYKAITDIKQTHLQEFTDNE